MSKIKYRPDIDGLRAISVILVVMFHIGLGCTGGFIGVDVFFVISGFLITSLILKESAGGSFSLAQFWVRRIRRIIPAAMASVAGTIVIGYFVLLPSDFSDLGRSAIAQSLFAANVFFWQDVGYFAGSAETKPLLHHWSLAVEEQYYVFYPVLVCLVLRLGRRPLFWTLICIALGSLLLSIVGVSKMPVATFYLLPFRAWELLIGALVALRPIKIRRPQVREFAAAAGLAAILIPAFSFDSKTPFPGVAAMLPCFGAVLLIVANSGTLTRVGQILALRPLVFVGLISYSLYLWHWPIIAYMRYLMLDFTPLLKLVTIAVSLAIAVLSWRFIEMPFRRRGSGKTATIGRPIAWRPFGFALGATVLMVSASAAIYLNQGWPNRFTGPLANLADDASWNGNSYEATPVEIQSGDYREIGSPDARPDSFLVWGDSHAMMLSEALDELAAKYGIKGRLLVTSGAPPIPDVWLRAEKKAAENRRIFEQVMRGDYRHVILIARWSAYTEGYSIGDLKFELKGRDYHEYLVQDTESKQKTREQARQVLRRHLLDMAKELKQKDIQLWIVKQVPEQLGPTAFPWFLQNRLGQTYDLYPTDYRRHKTRQQFVNQIIDEAASQGARVVETEYVCFDKELRPILVADGRACYRDNDHLSRFGAKRLGSPILSDIFESIAEADQTSRAPTPK